MKKDLGGHGFGAKGVPSAKAAFSIASGVSPRSTRHALRTLCSQRFEGDLDIGMGHVLAMYSNYLRLFIMAHSLKSVSNLMC